MVEIKGVFGVWFGGASYSGSNPANHLESFGSLDAARGALADRFGCGSVMHKFEYLLQPAVAVSTPAVEESSMIELYRVWIDAGDIRYERTDRRLVMGPKGGIRMEEV